MSQYLFVDITELAQILEINLVLESSLMWPWCGAVITSEEVANLWL